MSFGEQLGSEMLDQFGALVRRRGIDVDNLKFAEVLSTIDMCLEQIARHAGMEDPDIRSIYDIVAGVRDLRECYDEVNRQ
jgi:hypothetical protein